MQQLFENIAANIHKDNLLICRIETEKVGSSFFETNLVTAFKNTKLHNPKRGTEKEQFNGFGWRKIKNS